MADAMEMHHRLPKINGRVDELSMATWRAYVDQQLAPVVDQR